MSTIVTRTGKGSPLTHAEADANFTNLNTDKLEAATTATLTNKSINLAANTLSGTAAEFNAAVSDDNFVTDTVYAANTVQRTGSTASAIIPAGTTGQRDVSPAIGYSRFNTSLGKNETWNGSNWISTGGATGGGSDDVLYENAQTVTTSYTLTTNKNAMSAGPITVSDGVTVTVPTGATWSVI